MGDESSDGADDRKTLLRPEPQDANLALAEKLGMEIRQHLTGLHLTRDIYQKIPYSFVKRHTLLPFGKENKTILVAIADPLNVEAIENLRYMLDAPIRAVYSPRTVILSAINECYNTETGAASRLIEELNIEERQSGEDDDVEVYDLLESHPHQPPIIKLLNLILTEAIQQRVSDIHFEPSEVGLRVRYRIDGVLQVRHVPPPEYQGQMTTRIKVMAKLDIAEHRMPQDGRIRLKMGRREIDFRVSTVPVAGGERIVLRVLDKGNVTLGLEKIGMSKKILKEFQELIKMPEGILLVTGPTGSGKTTTLYSAIQEISNEEINIMTIEDPVEYQLPGIAQISVQHKIGLNFARGLRHILRQDPDVVMIGEIRDRETAEIAVQAALTGHLVFSTLHTNDAPSAITRLVDMDIEPYLLSSSIIGVLAQRLVRGICPYCQQPHQITQDELEALQLTSTDFIDAKPLKGIGCDQCFQTGYLGRHGVYELMPVTNAIRKQINISPDAAALRTLALTNQMTTLRLSGIQLICEGKTTVEEVLRVTRGIETE
ncbi:MAG: type II/IV secretion system protein [Chlamydiia bacterium]|nr:type II/IV secretion system protein [Chlamydiia bacterium]